MEATPYISIRSVLYDISTMMDQKEWNEANMLEWAYRALRKNKSTKIYTTKAALIDVYEHKFPLPVDLKYLHQIAYKVCTTEQLYEEVKEILGLDQPGFEGSSLPYSALLNLYNAGFNRWTPLRLSPSPFALSIHCGYRLPECPTCEHEYTVDEQLICTTSLKEGKVLISYMAYPENEDGDALMPDHPDLRDAIMHYCLHRHYMSKSLKAAGTDQSADRQRDYHLAMYQTLSAKSAGDMNLPSLNELDNYKRQHNRLVPRAHQYDKFFLGLNGQERVRNA